MKTTLYILFGEFNIEAFEEGRLEEISWTASTYETFSTEEDAQKAHNLIMSSEMFGYILLTKEQYDSINLPINQAK